MTDRQKLHDMRQQAHNAGIQGSSKMSEEQLKMALQKIGKGVDPATAKRKAKG